MGKHSAEANRQKSERQKGRVVSEETKARISAANTGKKYGPHSEEHKQKISKANKGNMKLGWTRGLTAKTDSRLAAGGRKTSLALKGRPKSAEHVEKVKRATKQYYIDHPEERQKIGERFKKLWENPLYAKQILHRRDMSGAEKIVDQILQKYELAYRFVGNGAFHIGRMNPDFIKDDSNLIIEVFGNHYHKVEDEKKRIDRLKEYGYRCLVIWASELKAGGQSIADKVLAFENIMDT